MVQIDSHCGFVKVNHVLSLDMSQYRKGFTLFHPMTWGWDVSAMNPTNFREGSGFLGVYQNIAYILYIPNELGCKWSGEKQGLSLND